MQINQAVKNEDYNDDDDDQLSFFRHVYPRRPTQ